MTVMGPFSGSPAEGHEMLERLGMIGSGGITATVLETLACELPAPLSRLDCLIRPGGRAAAEALLQRYRGRVADTVAVHEALPALLGCRPQMVIECAGHSAVREHGPAVLAAGIDLAVISIGALSDEVLHTELLQRARDAGARLFLPPGAVGGIDILAAARLSGIRDVVYTSRKPPQAWRGTPAEQLLDLDALTSEALFFEGTARAAARDYPQNANVAATIALAGAGFERTRVRLIADPHARHNVHEVSVRSGCADFHVRIEGKPSPVNPKTSLPTAFSIARLVLNQVAAQVI
jgi:aspartate dehydrogenase